MNPDLRHPNPAPSIPDAAAIAKIADILDHARKAGMKDPADERVDPARERSKLLPTHDRMIRELPAAILISAFSFQLFSIFP